MAIQYCPASLQCTVPGAISTHDQAGAWTLSGSGPDRPEAQVPANPSAVVVIDAVRFSDFASPLIIHPRPSTPTRLLHK